MLADVSKLQKQSLNGKMGGGEFPDSIRVENKKIGQSIHTVYVSPASAHDPKGPTISDVERAARDFGASLLKLGATRVDHGRPYANQPPRGHGAGQSSDYALIVQVPGDKRAAVEQFIKLNCRVMCDGREKQIPYSLTEQGPRGE